MCNNIRDNDVAAVLTRDLDIVDEAQEQRARVAGQRVVEVARHAGQRQRARRVRDARHARATLRHRDLEQREL